MLRLVVPTDAEALLLDVMQAMPEVTVVDLTVEEAFGMAATDVHIDVDIGYDQSLSYSLRVLRRGKDTACYVRTWDDVPVNEGWTMGPISWAPGAFPTIEDALAWLAPKPDHIAFMGG